MSKISSEETEPFFRFHKQNLNECRHCGHTIPGPSGYGRCWWHFGLRKELSATWDLFTRRNRDLAISLNIGDGDGEDGVTFRIAIPFVLNLFLGHEGFMRSRVRNVGGRWTEVAPERSYELRYSFGEGFDQWGSFVWSFGQDANGWSKGDPKWRHGYFDPCSFVLGKNVYAKELLGPPEKHTVRLPEGVYEVTAQRERATWKRPRWPKPLVKESWDFDCNLPVPGKGENSWDCGDDAIMGIGFDCEDVHEALRRLKERVMETRERYASRDWRPREKVA